MTDKPKHGGFRAGAGRKPQLDAPRHRVISLRLSVEELAHLDNLCRVDDGEGRSTALRRLISEASKAKEEKR
jgi:hypothetical protein